MTEVMELRPGQSIAFITEGTVTTPFGERKQETKVTLSYEDILTRFQRNTTSRIPRVPPGAKEFNRFAAVAQTGIEEGKWSNGSAADKTKVISDVLVKIQNLPENLHAFVTEKAQKHLEAISGNKALKPDQKKEIKEFLTKLKPEAKSA